MTKIINGRKIAEIIKNDLKNKIYHFDRNPCVVALNIGQNISSKKYLEIKSKESKKIGIKFKEINFDEKINQTKLLKKIKELNDDVLVDGIIVQFPLPKHLDSNIIRSTISQFKDVDGVNPFNKGKLGFTNSILIPPTSKAVITILKSENIKLKGKNVVIIGYGLVAGEPISILLKHQKATVIICDIDTKNIGMFTKKADIIISAAGKKNLLKGDMIEEGTFIINIGAENINGNLFPDVQYSTVEAKASFITPTPGGVGPLTVAHLLENVVKCYEIKVERNEK